MAASARHRHSSDQHFLNFFHDGDGGCALTVLINDVRFHIIADPKNLDAESGPGAKLAREYQELIRCVRSQEEDDDNRGSSSLKTNKASGNTDLDHEDKAGSEGEDHDSAIDLSSPRKKAKHTNLVEEAYEDGQKAIAKWLLQPFESIFADKAPVQSECKKYSVEEWYGGITFFFEVVIRDDILEAVEIDSTNELERRISNIVPKLTIPKKLRSPDIPWYSARNVIVKSVSDEPAPCHPSIVEVENNTLFFKTVDPTQSSPTKREIEILKKIEKLGLHHKFKVPLIQGFVGFEDSSTDIIGFLMTPINEPEPLTHLLDEDVPQSKRDRWARECDRIKKLLHDNDIIWGDAKADNFMVDKNDDLWIIDFGGSYTEGWVDPELCESQEGDDMGVEKIVNALHDPVANTMDPDDESDLKDKQEPQHKKKRKADEIDSEVSESDEKRRKRYDTKPPTIAKSSTMFRGIETREDDGRRSAKSDGDNDADAEKSGQSDNGEPEQEQYCFCNGKSSGDMVACDNDECKRVWFHFECVGLSQAPESDEWYCRDCRDASS